MAIIFHTRYFFLFYLLVLPIWLTAQETPYSFESYELVPHQEIKDLLDKHLELCFNNTNILTNQLQQHIQFYKQNDSLKINLTTSPKVITDVQVEWEVLNIKGVFYYKNRLVIVEADNDVLQLYKTFFTKQPNILKLEIKLDSYGEPSCSTLYYIKKNKLKFLDKIFMY